MFDAIVLAGGAGRRMDGADKAALRVGGVTLLDRVLAGVARAQQVVVVGPRREVARSVVWSLEEPPGGGPVAAVAAGLGHVTAPMVVVLATDLPAIAPAVPRLVDALEDETADVAAVVDRSGRVNYLATAWRREVLQHALASLGEPAGAAMRSLFRCARLVTLPDRDGWSADCDTWDDLAVARRRIEQGGS